jgi:hypothetical protein
MVEREKGASAPSLVEAALAVLEGTTPKADTPRKTVSTRLLDSLSEALARSGA